MNMLRNKKILAALAVIAVLLVIASIVSNGDTTEQQEDNQPVLSESDKKFFAEKDKKKAESLNNVLNSITVVYREKRLDFPDATEAGWSQIINTVPITEAFLDPYLDQIYQFASKENPEYGEIQYGPGMACDEQSKDKVFKAGYGRTSLALRAKFSDGYRCVNNFQG